MLKRWSIILVSCLLTFFTLQATTIVPYTNLGELTTSAEMVVFAEALHKTEVVENGTTYYYQYFEIIDRVKGNTNKTVAVRFMSKTQQERSVAFAGEIEYKGGENYLLFLNTYKDAYFPICVNYYTYQEVTQDKRQFLVPVAKSQTAHTLKNKRGAEPLEVYNKENLLGQLKSIAQNKTKSWDRTKSAASSEFQRLKAPHLKVRPDHCELIINGRWRDQENSSIGIYYENKDVGCSDVGGRVQQTVDYLQSNYRGLNLEVKGAVSDYNPDCSVSNASGSSLLNYVNQTIGDSRSIMIIFNDPCEEIPNLNGCSGTLAFGGTYINSQQHIFDDQSFAAAQIGFVVVNEQSMECLCDSSTDNVSDVTLLLTHEMTHSLALDHISTADGVANMNASCCNIPTDLDKQCLDYLYPPFRASVQGCTDANAHNYNPNATEDDGSCLTCNDGIMNGDETDVDCGGTKCDACPDETVRGCTNENAHNYNPNANEDDGTCQTCDDGVMNGDETGVDCGGTRCDACPDETVQGCTNADAHNYNPNANEDDGTCQTCDDGVMNGDETGVDCGGTKCDACPDETVRGCTDENAHNYNPNANEDDGTCQTCDDGVMNGDETGVDCGGTKCDACPDETVQGCTDENAHNYNPNANEDDGSCQTCTDGIMNGDEEAVDCGGALCMPCTVGCLDSLSHNYNPNAEVQGDVVCLTCTDGIMNGDEEAVDCGGALCMPCTVGCLDSLSHNYNPNAEVQGDVVCLTCTDGIMNGDEEAIDCGGALCMPCTVGCLDSLSHNYNPNAEVQGDVVCLTCNDGIMNGDEEAVDCGGALCMPCTVGCLDSLSHNYNPNAEVQGDVVCLTCNDGIMNGDEEAVDCGGALCMPCTVGCLDSLSHNYNPNAEVQGDVVCMTCTDGIMNGDEEAVDCGGALCMPCTVGCLDSLSHNYNPNAEVQGDVVCLTCTDGIMNGDEEAVDCGGALCMPCTVGCLDSLSHNYNPNAQIQGNAVCQTCDDGIQNGDEEGIDCGGSCPNSCPIFGCTDENAHNYYSEADIDDGTCMTCDDGLRNGDETDIDCGGILCEPCDFGEYCDVVTELSGPYRQSFEAEMKLWDQSDLDNTDWTRTTARTPSTETGPPSAYDGFYYLFIEASNHLNETAILESQCMDLDNFASPHLLFNYHMYGSTMGELIVSIETDSGIERVFYQKGDQGNEWQQASIDLSAYKDAPIRIQIEGIIGVNFRSDMAIDNLQISESGN